MNVQMRIITDENVDQLLSMSYSKNIQNLLHTNEPTEAILKNVAQNINLEIKESRTKTTKYEVNDLPNEPQPYLSINREIQQDSDSPAYIPPSTPSDYGSQLEEFDPWPVQYAPDIPAVSQGQQKFTRPDTPYYVPQTPSATPPSEEEITYPYTPIVQEFGKTPQQNILEVETVENKTTGTNDTGTTNYTGTNTETNNTETNDTGTNETKKIIINKNE
jgi:hypothetical protein